MYDFEGDDMDRDDYGDRGRDGEDYGEGRDGEDYGEDYGEGRDGDDYGDDYGDQQNDYGEEQQFTTGFKEAQQMSQEDLCGSIPELLVKKGGDAYANLKNSIRFLTSNPEARFKIFVKAISIRINEDGIAKLSVNDRNTMCGKADKIKNTKYLNPTAYVLAYVCTKGGGNIDKKIFKDLVSKLDKLDDDSIKPADIIRYSRFIQKNF
jgi:hypothetical protein